MNTMRVLYHVALADFFERARQYRFLLTLAAILALGILVNNGTLYVSLQPGNWKDPLASGYRGEFNSAWVGTMTILVANTVLFLIGFYLVSDCIARDIRTGVGQIIATTPIRRATYLVGKWLSNFLVLSLLVLILAIAAATMVLLKHEAVLDPGRLLIPFIAVGLPNMALVAALAVVFETVPWLRGVVGNVVHFLLWGLLGSVSISGAMDLGFIKDPLGLNVFSTSLRAGAQAAFPNDMVGTMTVGGGADYGFKTFNWLGLTWTPQVIGEQWLWAVIGLGLVLLSAIWFARFDPSREGLRHVRVKPDESKESEPAEPRKNALLATQFKVSSFISKLTLLLSVSPLISKLARLNPFLGVLFAEMRMLFNGRRWWWWLILAGLNIAILIYPLELVSQYLLPIAFLWILPILSEMGNRERKNNTYQMVFSSPRPVLRQLPAAWLAGVLATALFGIAGGVVFLINSNLPALAGWAGAVIFIPTLALALGVISSGSRVFEVVYVIWWYVGPMQKTPGMDFIGGPPLIYLLAAAGLLVLIVFWRGRQVRV